MKIDINKKLSWVEVQEFQGLLGGYIRVADSVFDTQEYKVKSIGNVTCSPTRFFIGDTVNCSFEVFPEKTTLAELILNYGILSTDKAFNKLK